MRIRGIVVTAVVAGSLGWFGRSVFSQDAPADSAADMQAEMMRCSQPGEEHARLIKAFAGEWTAHGKFYMGETPMESDSTAKLEPILDGRFLRQEVHGSISGMPFEGRSIVGYNVGTKKYVSAWIDGMGTGIMMGTGEEKEPGKTYEFRSSYDFGKFQMNSREVWKVVSPDEYTLTMWSVKDGKEKLVMEVVSKRKK